MIDILNTPTQIHNGLTELQQLCGETSESKGFHEDHPNRDDFALGERGALAFKRAMGHYQGNLLMLIVSEAVEAHDEIRTGHRANETYYPTNPENESDKWLEWKQGPHKPEGVPSEVADIVIRCFDHAYRNKYSLADIIIEKLAYNATRERMHGGKAF